MQRVVQGAFGLWLGAVVIVACSSDQAGLDVRGGPGVAGNAMGTVTGGTNDGNGTTGGTAGAPAAGQNGLAGSGGVTVNGGSGGMIATGGTGGTMATGGNGAGSGGTGTGGTMAGGSGGTAMGGTGGSSGTGGMNTGGMNTGGMNTGGMNTGGMNTGGMNTGGMNTGGMMTGGAGGTGDICDEGGFCQTTAARYAEAVEAARQCTPAADGQCLQAVPSSIPCGCNVPVNDATEPKAIHAEWQNAGCAQCPVVCPTVLCVHWDSAQCVARDNGTSGVCQIKLAQPL